MYGVNTSPSTGDPLLTPVVREVIDGVIHAHRQPGLQVIHGPVGVGKTTIARYLVNALNAGTISGVPKDCRGLYFPAAGDTGHRGMKAGIHRLHAPLLGELTSHAFRTRLPESIAADVVNACRKKGIQLLCVDEAGTLSAEEIRGFVHVYDDACRRGWPLTIVLIGMAKPLLEKIKSQEQVESRVMKWTRIEPWDLDDMWALLVRLNPRFRPPEAADAEHRELVKFVHETYGGVPRHVLPFLNELDRRLAQAPDLPCDLTLCKYIAHVLHQGESISGASK